MAVGVRGRRMRMRRVSPVPQRGAASVPSSAVPSEIFFRKEAGPAVEFSGSVQGAWDSNPSLVLFFQAPPKAEDGSSPMPELDAVAEDLDHALGGALRKFMLSEAFAAKAGETKVLPIFGKTLQRAVLVGLGPGDGKDAAVDWRAAGAAAAKVLKDVKEPGSVGVACAAPAVDIRTLVEGFYLGLHVDRRFRGSQQPDEEKQLQGPTSLELLGLAGSSENVDLVKRGQAVASGVIFGRELVNAPANFVNPPNLVAAAENLAAQVGLEVKIITEAECEEMGMGSFLSVGRCSNLPSQVIHLTYRPTSGQAARKVGIVGKGLTFDSGGYNLKVGAGCMIEKMKFDMGGAAATLGAAASVAQLRPEGVEAHFIVATCENMVSGNQGALRPGDIVTAMDGTTIEVNNTDAEGRLTLADAMLYAQQQGVEEVVDVATLTGACMVALGSEVAGMWSNSDQLAANLDAAAKGCGEKIWRMPLEEAYWEGMKSDLADMKNTGPSFGGAITAALFLQKFVKAGVNWAHIDIAGTVWAEKAKGINAVGGTGSMVRTLTQHVVKG